MVLAFLCAYLEFRHAARDARDAGMPVRDNPVPWSSKLELCGFGKYVLLWMYYQGHIETVAPAEKTKADPAGLAPWQSRLFGESSAFALTELGEAFAETFLSQMLLPNTPEERQAAWDMLQVGELVPCYDFEGGRWFSWGRHVIKHFRQQAGNQELVLCAGQEQSWPIWFDDPLPPVSGINPKQRLHDTIKDLNRRQKEPLVQFKGDGTGTRVGWELR